MTTTRPSLVISFFFIFGLLVRILVALVLPISPDEVFSLSIINNPINLLHTAILDPPHAPGYYLILKFLNQITDKVPILRLIHLSTYIASFFIVYTISKQQSGKYYYLPLLYALSGYFLTYEFQLRSYSLIATLIFLNLLLDIKNQSKIIPRTALHVAGLYLDYGYLWFFVPWVIFNFIKKSKAHLQIAITSIVSFLIIFPYFFSRISGGIAGVDWLSDTFNRLNPLIFIPFFLGVKQYILSKIIFFILFAYGVIRGLKSNNVILKQVLFYSLVSGSFCYIYSLLIVPIFHYRSLQIIAISGLFSISFALNNLKNSMIKNLLLIVVFLNFFISLHNLFTIDDITELQLLSDQKQLVHIVNNSSANNLYYSLTQANANVVDEQMAELLANRRFNIARLPKLQYVNTVPSCTNPTPILLPGDSFLYLCQ